MVLIFNGFELNFNNKLMFKGYKTTSAMRFLWFKMVWFNFLWLKLHNHLLKSWLNLFFTTYPRLCFYIFKIYGLGNNPSMLITMIHSKVSKLECPCLTQLFLLVKNAFTNQVTYDFTAKLFGLDALINLTSSFLACFHSFHLFQFHHLCFPKYFITFHHPFFQKLNAFQNLILCQKSGTFIFQKQLSGSDTTAFTNNAHGGHALSFSYMINLCLSFKAYVILSKTPCAKKSNQVLFTMKWLISVHMLLPSHVFQFILISFKMNMLSQNSNNLNMACVF
uniref:Transmembrane protein n=1 Tax=Panagrolaimus sp. PS1159 TaxID=55785 RepID=A0AC35G4Z8_9BILA